jgi:hypothetical protein
MSYFNKGGHPTAEGYGNYTNTSYGSGGMTDEERNAGAGGYKPDPINYSDRDYSSGVSAQTSGDSIESASDKMARITREQWADYKLRFQPYEDRLAAAYANGGLLEGERDRIPTTIDQSFNSMKGIANRGLSRYGISSSQDGMKARDRSMGLNKSLASVDAYNTLYKVADERQDKLMTGGLSGVDSRGKQS